MPTARSVQQTPEPPTRACRDNWARLPTPRRGTGCSTVGRSPARPSWTPMNPHVAQCHAAAARHPIVLMVHDDTILDFSPHRTLKGAGRVGDDRGTGFLAHSCLAVLPSGATLGLAHQTIWARPPKGVTPQTRESAVWAETVETIGCPPEG